MHLVFALFDITLSQSMPFLPIASAPTLVSWSTEAQLCFPLHSIPFSTAALVIIFGTHVMASLRQVQCKQRHFLRYSLLEMLDKCSMSWKQNQA